MKKPHSGEYLDCIVLKRSIQREIAAETKGMTPKDRLVYYRKLAQESPFVLPRPQLSRMSRNRVAR